MRRLPPPRKNWLNRSRKLVPPVAAEIESAEIELHARAGIFRRHGPAPLGVETELVVRLPLLRIRQNVVRFLDLLEFFFRGFIAGIQVGVILARQLPVGLREYPSARLCAGLPEARNNPAW